MCSSCVRVRPRVKCVISVNNVRPFVFVNVVRVCS